MRAHQFMRRIKIQVYWQRTSEVKTFLFPPRMKVGLAIKKINRGFELNAERRSGLVLDSTGEEIAIDLNIEDSFGSGGVEIQTILL